MTAMLCQLTGKTFYAIQPNSPLCVAQSIGTELQKLCVYKYTIYVQIIALTVFLKRTNPREINSKIVIELPVSLSSNTNAIHCTTAAHHIFSGVLVFQKGFSVTVNLYILVKMEIYK